MFNMLTGEVMFGGVGSGLYGMLLFVVLAVFIAGLMVGRTPEYLGKKIEAREVKLVMIGTLFVPLLVLSATALAIATKWGAPSIYNPGPQGFSETLYAYISQPQQQRLGLRRLHGLPAAKRPATRAPSASPSRTCWAGSRCSFGRFVPLLAALAVAGALAPKRVLRSAPARSAPTRPRSWCC